MEIKDFKKLMLHLDKEIVIDKENLLEKIKQIPLLYHQYLDIFSKEYRILKTMQASKKKKFGELYKHFKFEDNHKWDTKGEIESQIHSRDDYYKLVIECNEQESMVQQLELALENIKRMSFQIKNMIEYMKFIEVGY